MDAALEAEAADPANGSGTHVALLDGHADF
jgi:hypothetical protein